jgi:hypothetical protein
MLNVNLCHTVLGLLPSPDSPVRQCAHRTPLHELHVRRYYADDQQEEDALLLDVAASSIFDLRWHGDDFQWQVPLFPFAFWFGVPLFPFAFLVGVPLFPFAFLVRSAAVSLCSFGSECRCSLRLQIGIFATSSWSIWGLASALCIVCLSLPTCA